jgi:hypothetical protein
VPEAADDQFRALLEMARLPQHEAMEVSEGGEVDTKSGECTTSAGIADDRLCARHFYGSVSSATVILALRHSRYCWRSQLAACARTSREKCERLVRAGVSPRIQ